MQLGKEVIADAEKGAYMNFTLNGKEHMEVPVAQATTVEESGTLCYVFKCSVPAKDMDTEITAQLILSDGRKGCVYTYTVNEYIDSIKNDDKYINERELVNAMSNFGNFATAYFGDGTLEETDAMKAVEAADLSGYKPAITGDENNIYYASSLLLKSDTILRHYFKEPVEGSKKKGDVYYIDSPGIPAHKLGDTTFVTEIEGITIQYNPLSYAYLVLGQNNIDEELKSVVRAMYLYYDAAQKYFTANQN